MNRLRLALLLLALACGLGAVAQLGARPADVAQSGSLPAATVSTTGSAAEGAATHLFPRVVQRLTLAAEGGEIRDFRRNPLNGELYVTDSLGRLHIVDGATLSVTAMLPVGGDLTLDAARGRLYLSPGDDYVKDEAENGISVVDLAQREVVGWIPAARYLTLDPAHGRIFTGSHYSFYTPAETAPVRVYDMETLEQTGEASIVGIPLYNPRRNELLVTTYTALVLDPDTFTTNRDLFPEYSERSCRDCMGQNVAHLPYLFADANLIAITLYHLSAGAGAGIYPGPVFFDASTLRQITEPAGQPIWRASCSSQPHLLWPIDGRRYRNYYYSRYVFYWNLTVEDIEGNPLAFRDGLYLSYIDPVTGQAVVDNGYVLDLETLLPLGRFPSFCWLDADPATGAFYGRDGRDLLVMANTGGEPAAPAAPTAEPLPASYILDILPSPAYAEDNTLFVLVNSRQLYRSRDGGESWERLRGGLPETGDTQLSIAISPAFADDQTLFAGGYIRTYQGEGVLRSQDGGDTWQPVWDGLEYLRVMAVSVSPDYAVDGQVAADADFTRITPWVTGGAVYTSTDRGLHWTEVQTSTSTYYRTPLSELWGPSPLPVRVEPPFHDTLQVRAADGSWQPSGLLRALDETFKELVASPHYATDGTIYLLGRSHLWRTLDGGVTWQEWLDDRLAGRTYENELTALAAVVLPSGEAALWLGTAAGELWLLDPAVLEFGPARSPTPTPAPVVLLPTLTPTPVPPAATPTPLPAEPLQGEPPAGLFRPQGSLASLWESAPGLQQALGWAKSQQPSPIQAARQTFIRGDMVWRADTATIYVIGRDGRWQAFPDTFVEGEAESDPSLTPPNGLLQPVRGFGKLWRTHPEVQRWLGWARAKESGYNGFVQEFERGLLISGGDRTFALIGEDQGEVWR